jgi:hypothetical protein
MIIQACKFCDKTSGTHLCLEELMLMDHQAHKNQPCEVCGETFESNACLEEHMLLIIEQYTLPYGVMNNRKYCDESLTRSSLIF